MGFEQPFSTDGHAGKVDIFVEKKATFLSKSNAGEFTSAIYHEQFICWPFKISSDY